MTTTTSHALPRGYTVRAPRLDDAEAIAGLMNADARATIGVDVTTTEDVLSDLQDPARNVEDENWLVHDGDGWLAAALSLYEYPPYTRFDFGAHVHPSHVSRGIGTFLLETIERRARRELHRAPKGERVVLQTGVWGRHVAAQRLLVASGFAISRVFRRMEIDVTAPPATPMPPDGIAITTLTRGQDERALYETMEAAFSDHWGYAPMPYDEFIYYEIEGAPDFDATLVFLAMAGDEMAGAALCRPSRAGDESIGWVTSLGVRREWRGRGIGQALLLHAFGEMHRRGKRTVGLNVDASSLTGADRLYERAGMHEVRRSCIFEKELRPAAG